MFKLLCDGRDNKKKQISYLAQMSCHTVSSDYDHHAINCVPPVLLAPVTCKTLTKTKSQAVVTCKSCFSDLK